MQMRLQAPRQARRETLLAEAASSFLLREVRLQPPPFSWHFHPEVELTLILSGTGQRIVGDSIQDYQAGDLCLVGPNLPHTWFSRQKTGMPVCALVAQFLPELFGEAFLSLPEAHRVRSLFGRVQRGLCVRGMAKDPIAKRFVRLSQTPAGSLLRITELLAVLDLIAANSDCVPIASSSNSVATSAANQRRINAVFAYLEGHVGDVISQPAVARRLSLSPSAFSRFFRQTVGMTFVAYVNAMRVSHACRALLETDRTVTEIAQEVGFNNLSNFNRQFRRFKGMTPRKYRRLTRTEETPP